MALMVAPFAKGLSLSSLSLKGFDLKYGGSASSYASKIH